jgi:23S rRNA pseudouridine1911/1915/1917 synthase
MWEPLPQLFFMKLLDKDLPFKIIFEDNHLLVLEKPAGMLTQPDMSGSLSLEDLAKIYLKEKYEKKGDVFLHSIHRLDKQVSGLVIFAKTSKALSRLNQQMREKKIIKKYIALVHGIFTNKKGELINYLVHSSHRAEISSKEDKIAKRAELFYEVLHEEKNKSLVSIELATGRYHQIRAQLSAFGHPIIGDEKYGSQEKREELFLHCSSLEFFHPISNKKIQFSSLLPKRFQSTSRIAL